MRRIFASVLAVIMLVSCFAVSTSAAATQADFSLSAEQITEEGKEYLYLTFTIDIVSGITTNQTQPSLNGYFFVYPAGAIKSLGRTFDKGIMADYTGDFYETTDYDDVVCDMWEFGYQEGDSLAEGQPAQVVWTEKFEILCDAGTEIRLVDDGTTWTSNGAENFVPEMADFVYTVKAAETTPPETDPPTTEAPVYTTAAVVGGQIRHASIDGSKDMRLCFAVTDNGADVASKAFKVTIGGDTKTVDCVKVFDTKGDVTYYTVCIYDIPADAFDTEISAVLELTHADGTVTASDVLTRTVNGVEAIMAA